MRLPVQPAIMGPPIAMVAPVGGSYHRFATISSPACPSRAIACQAVLPKGGHRIVGRTRSCQAI